MQGRAYRRASIGGFVALVRFQGRPLVLQFTDSYYYAIGRLEILA